MKSKLKNFGIICLVVIVAFNFYNTQRFRIGLNEAVKVLNDNETIQKANTADTINKIQNEMWTIADFRLDRLDSVNNLSH